MCVAVCAKQMGQRKEREKREDFYLNNFCVDMRISDNDIWMVVVWLECWLREISQIVECCARGGFEADIFSFAHLHHFH